MNKAIKSRHYAEVLLQLAEREHAGQAVYEQFGPFVSTYRQISILRAILISMQVTSGQKQQLLEGVFGEKLHPILLAFVLQLAQRRDLKLLRLIASKAEQIYREQQNSVKVVATSSSELSESQLKHITKQIVDVYGKQPEMVTVVDPEIIGGLRLRVGNVVIDGSLATRLGQIKKKLIQS